MSLASRYLFDNSFDAPRKGGPAEPAFTEAEIAAEQARHQERESAAALAAAHAQGFAQGRALGRDEGVGETEASLEAQTLTLIQLATESLAELAQNEKESRRRADAAALGCTATILRRMVPALLERTGLQEIEALLAQCLTQAQDEPRLVLRVPPLLFDSVQRRIERISHEAAFSGKIVLLADATLGAGAARLEWADGGAERDPQRLWSEMEGALTRILASTPEPVIEHRTKPSPATPATDAAASPDGMREGEPTS